MSRWSCALFASSFGVGWGVVGEVQPAGQACLLILNCNGTCVRIEELSSIFEKPGHTTIRLLGGSYVNMLLWQRSVLLALHRSIAAPARKAPLSGTLCSSHESTLVGGAFHVYVHSLFDDSPAPSRPFGSRLPLAHYVLGTHTLLCTPALWHTTFMRWLAVCMPLLQAAVQQYH